MTTQSFDTADELRRMIGDGRISADALQAITGIQDETLASFLNGSRSETIGLSRTPSSLSADESTRLSHLAAQLTEGFQIDDDVRLMAIIETLTAQCHLTHQNIAALTRTGLDDLQGFLRDPDTLPLERKYQLAIRASYLINAVANAASASARH
ncbi:MAG TPA: HTH domain-containing protein [Thermomicrobiales bacterium]|nr:HTH domain-containing protein [Thermomicrobiales bacterium]